MLAAINFRAIAQRDDGDAVGARPGGKQSRLMALDAFLVDCPYPSLRGDLHRFYHGFLSQARINQQNYIDRVWRDDSVLRKRSFVAYGQSVATADGNKTNNFPRVIARVYRNTTAVLSGEPVAPDDVVSAPTIVTTAT